MTEAKRNLYGFHSTVTIILIFGFGFLPPLSPITPIGMKILGIFLGLLYGWTTVGLIWPSLLGMIALGLTGIMTTKDVFLNGFGSDTTLMILFILIFAAIVEEAGISQTIAMWFVTRKVLFGKPWLFSFVFLLAAYVLSAATSTMAAIVICWGILYGICEKLGFKAKDAYPTLMVIGVVYSCTLGLSLFPFKSVPLGLLAVFTQLSGITIPFINYVGFTLPVGICSLILFSLLGKFVFRPNVAPLKGLNQDTFGEEANLSLDKRQKTVLGFLVALIVLLLVPSILPKSWGITAVLNGIGTTGIVMLLCALMTMIKINGQPLMNFGKIAAKGVQWEVIILTAVVIPIAAVLTADATGIKPFLLQILAPIFMGKPPLFFIMLVVLLSVVVTNLCNNGVTGVLFITLTYDLGVQMGVNSSILAVIIIFCVHLAILTPAGSPMAALLHGNKNWVAAKAVYKYGLLAVFLTAILIIVLGIPLANILF